MKARLIAGIGSTALALMVGVQGVAAQDGAPNFMTQTFPQAGVDAAWEEFQALMGEGALDPKTKELVGLAVAAQVPCDYCVYYHTKAANAHGATEEEIKEALASAALVRKWSTMLHGSQYSMEEWRQEVDAMFAQ
ncbi:carboxymuconolactone decarboxylase family protein [Nitratireductor thuwali]|uniref:Alkyl hydroperoxide reductase AhpD n=1 Tax=Nitratireductor thuwali TaxID=2267699 RepID=A0ABY5MNF9_9HYPH|nr:Alkyl hydroperoxide reductase AhpD [Nitratireductor thuwali]